jgi:hypothetical protein
LLHRCMSPPRVAHPSSTTLPPPSVHVAPPLATAIDGQPDAVSPSQQLVPDPMCLGSNNSGLWQQRGHAIVATRLPPVTPGRPL